MLLPWRTVRQVAHDDQRVVLSPEHLRAAPHLAAAARGRPVQQHAFPRLQQACEQLRGLDGHHNCFLEQAFGPISLNDIRPAHVGVALVDLTDNTAWTLARGHTGSHVTARMRTATRWLRVHGAEDSTRTGAVASKSWWHGCSISAHTTLTPPTPSRTAVRSNPPCLRRRPLHRSQRCRHPEDYNQCHGGDEHSGNTRMHRQYVHTPSCRSEVCCPQDPSLVGRYLAMVTREHQLHLPTAH